jgi:hypothetical protein
MVTPEDLKELFRAAGEPLTHTEMLNLFNQVFHPVTGATLQGARSALIQDGLICKFGKVKTPGGRPLETYGLCEWIGAAPAADNAEIEEIEVDE